MRNMVPDNPQFHHYELLEVLAGDFQGMAHSVGVGAVRRRFLLIARSRLD